MKRAALFAAASVAALACGGPTPAAAWSNNSEFWSGARTPSSTSDRQPRYRSYIGPPERGVAPGARRTERTAERTPVLPPSAPKGPLQIIVSIDKQRATLFENGVAVASTAVSSGTAGHPTPMGVFSVIQKDRHHISNLYDAPMPYMQRITWSGSALHEGPLPGYPASHGCVRLPTGFAQLLWKTTKLGARVIITRPEVAPVEIEHARLFVPKPRPAAEPVAEPVAAPVTTSTVVKTATADADGDAMRSAIAAAREPIRPVMTGPAANTPSPEQPTKLTATDGAGGLPAASRTAGANLPEKSAAPAPAIIDERPATMPASVREVKQRPISIFVSLKEKKLYVRQGWQPLFDAPVSFERPEQPIGTHVYTAMGMKASGDGLRWTVVSIPSGPTRVAERRVTESRDGSRRQRVDHLKTEIAVSMPSAGSALDRIVMPPELVDRISAMVTPGSSLIVSDNGLSDETDESTDFIVLTR